LIPQDTALHKATRFTTAPVRNSLFRRKSL